MTLVALGPRVITRTTPANSRTSGDEHARGPDRPRPDEQERPPALAAPG
ncbi:hypothetical protein [Actinomadura violacea]|uniref:Uncharacterized protein n=1 Tax=Actinomadura violacea TaxID=2819934 RepID=A0ABS3RMC3_9ACTN|nr:hypothetical protein [Actinomadura violacea]MBO2457478.1 hypothetical protein [Actinomadura violacea]